MPENKRMTPMVTDEDRQLAAKDTYTTRLFGKFAPEMYAAGFRIDGETGAYVPMNELFDFGAGRGKMGFLPDGNGSFDVVEIKEGKINQVDDGSSQFRRRSPQDIMDIINKTYRFRYDQLQAQNQPVAKQ
jgi:hypothetical protein